ncbi:MAG: family 43 glycosylhydrolase [Alphaproteobacteria bacterium]
MGDPSLADHFAAMDPPLRPGDWTIHDPSRVVSVGGVQMVAATARAQEDGYGCGLETWVRPGPDASWQPGACLLTQKPAWIDEVFQDQEGAFWAPAFLDENTLFYAVSDGLDRDGATCLGLARAHGTGPERVWRDGGQPVTCSPGDTPVGEGAPEAIDPAALTAPDGNRYLVFGGGVVVLVRINDHGLPVALDRPDGAGADPVVLARAPAGPENGETWIEAPFLHYRDGFFYLFVNVFDCCQAADSRYEIHVGRSNRVVGPYLTKDGLRLDEGHATPLMPQSGPRIGPGQAGIWSDDQGTDWLTFHYYDENREGLPWIGERRIAWRDGWPEIVPDPAQQY